MKILRSLIFFKYKIFIVAFPMRGGITARVDGGIETFLVGLERRVNDIYVNVMSYTKACGKVATRSHEAHRGTLKNFLKYFFDDDIIFRLKLFIWKATIFNCFTDEGTEAMETFL